jgi:formylglycine-generating enzyme required for sulfatase activity
MMNGNRSGICSALILLTTLACHLGCDQRNARQSGEPARQVAFLVPITNMVLIKAGSFVRQKQLITITRDFWLGAYEITQGEYQAITGKNPSNFRGDFKRPVERVRHHEALDYCAAITRRENDAGRLPTGLVYRLPTEAEWEYACRAGATNLFSFGDDGAIADQYAWTLENSDATTHPVGLKGPNPWGLYDIHGNVWEWTLDWFADYPAGDLKDPIGPAQGTYKVFRGGSWNHAVEFARSRNRFMMSPTNGINFVGFRLALGHTLP